MANAPEAARLIQRCMRLDENARFLRRLPGLQLDQEMPSTLRDLLGRLHQVEMTGRSTNDGGGRA